jgi:hypothetical protein
MFIANGTPNDKKSGKILNPVESRKSFLFLFSNTAHP